MWRKITSRWVHCQLQVAFFNLQRSSHYNFWLKRSSNIAPILPTCLWTSHGTKGILENLDRPVVHLKYWLSLAYVISFLAQRYTNWEQLEGSQTIYSNDGWTQEIIWSGEEFDTIVSSKVTSYTFKVTLFSPSYGLIIFVFRVTVWKSDNYIL